MALKENYKDDILDVSVNTKRKYRMTENPDGTVSFDDETTYTQQGDSFGASDMNATNGKVNTLESDIGEINDNLNVRWNSITDHFEVLKNGNWVQSIKAYVNSIAVWMGGVFGISISNGVYLPTSSASSSNLRSFTVSGNSLISSITTNSHFANLVSDDLIDFSNYDHFKVKTVEKGEIDLNVSSFTGQAYIYIQHYKTSQGLYGVTIGITNEKQYYQTNKILYNTVGESSTPSTLTISEIIIE